MAEVLLVFSATVRGANGSRYEARACGRPAEGRQVWEGWIEFIPSDGGTPLRTPRETTQPNREDLVYWASGLSDAFFDGALDRALQPPKTVAVPPEQRPAFEGPAPAIVVEGVEKRGRAVLDPVEVYREGEDVLRQQLRALDISHLRNIVRAYHLTTAGDADVQAMTRVELTELIVVSARKLAS